MAWAKRRANGNWTAIFRDAANQERSVGTYATKELALDAAEQAERFHRTPHTSGMDPVVRANMTLQVYSERFLAVHQVAQNTLSSYRLHLRNRILPAFGSMRLADITTEMVRGAMRDWQDKGASPATLRQVRATFSAVMQMAYVDGYTTRNPVRGIPVPRQGRKPIKVLTVEQFQALLDALPTDGAKLLALTKVSTGIRHNEALGLQVGDLVGARLTVSRVVNELDEPDANNQRWEVVPWTKMNAGEPPRALSLHQGLRAAWTKHADTHNLGPQDYLFTAALVVPEEHLRSRRRDLGPPPEPSEFVAANGRTYIHGTVNGYVVAKCRCPWCRQASSDYSVERKRAKARPARPKQARRPGSPSDSGPWVTTGQWRRIWDQAVLDAGLPFKPTSYQLRHTHASWLVNAGEDVKTVMNRLGHRDLSITSLYVQDLGEDQSAADIMDSLLDF